MLIVQQKTKIAISFDGMIFFLTNGFNNPDKLVLLQTQ